MKRTLLIAALIVSLATVSCKPNQSSENAAVAEVSDAVENEGFDVKIISDETTSDGLRKVSVETCSTVCSTRIDIVLEGDVIRDIAYTGGCNGNLKGIASLVSGMKVEDVIGRLDGTDCAGRGTSCPDQLARALKLLM